MLTICKSKMTSRRRAIVVAFLVGLTGSCSDQSPPVPTVAGAWTGTAHVRPDVFALTLTQQGTAVTGSGTWTVNGAPQAITVAGTFESGTFFDAAFSAGSSTLTYESLLATDRVTLLGIVSGITGGDRILDLTRQP